MEFFTVKQSGPPFYIHRLKFHIPLLTFTRKFVRNQLFKASIFYALFDLIWYFLQSSIYGSPQSPSLLSDTPLRQVFFGWAAGLVVYFTANIPYPLFAALTVATGIYEPYDWPPLMGKLRDVVTVRDLWGKFWHQCLRRVSFLFPAHEKRDETRSKLEIRR